jgi:hypothetical protein
VSYVIRKKYIEACLSLCSYIKACADLASVSGLPTCGISCFEMFMNAKYLNALLCLRTHL